MNARERAWGAPVAAGTSAPRRRPTRARTASGMLGATRKPAKGEQATFANTKTSGGPRIDSGRKAGLRPKVRHRTRPRIVHYSVQADHLHLLVEADDPATLTSGMRSFSVRVAMRVNHRVLQRTRGHVWGDRYHRRELTSPSAVRNALVYVLSNHIKHGEYDVGLLDPCSSAPWFTGWMHMRAPPPATPPPTEPPSTWLLEKGWSTVGLGAINLGEVPRSTSCL